MNQSKISDRYAKALFQLCKEKQVLENVKPDIELLNKACSIPEFNEFLNSPVIPISEKQTILKQIFENKLHKFVTQLLLLMAKNRREQFLKIITLNFLKFYRDYFGIVETELTTVDDISQENKQKIVSLLKDYLKADVDIKNYVNPNIIGGFILRIDDKQIDASIKTQLQEYKKQLTKSL